MKKSQFISLGILLIAVTILIIIGAFKKNDKDPFLANPTPSEKSTPVVLETPDPNEQPTPTPSPTPTPQKTPVVFPDVDKNYVNSMSSIPAYWWVNGIEEKNGEKYVALDNSVKKYVEGFDYIFTNEQEGTKTISLTFNEGWEDADQNTKAILDILRNKGVKATFYLSKEYLANTKNHDLIRRMHNEGHSLGSRGTVDVREGMSALPTDVDQAIKLMLDMEEKLQEILSDNTVRMTSYRPAGQFSKKDLALATQLGYKITLWSFSYADWETVKDKNATLTNMKNYVINGTVYSLSATNKANSELLGDLIDYALSQGYSFARIG